MQCSSSRSDGGNGSSSSRSDGGCGRSSSRNDGGCGRSSSRSGKSLIDQNDSGFSHREKYTSEGLHKRDDNSSISGSSNKNYSIISDSIVNDSSNFPTEYQAILARLIETKYVEIVKIPHDSLPEEKKDIQYLKKKLARYLYCLSNLYGAQLNRKNLTHTQRIVQFVKYIEAQIPMTLDIMAQFIDFLTGKMEFRGKLKEKENLVNEESTSNEDNFNQNFKKNDEFQECNHFLNSEEIPETLDKNDSQSNHDDLSTIEQEKTFIGHCMDTINELETMEVDNETITIGIMIRSISYEKHYWIYTIDK